MQLANPDRVIVDERKVADYCLNPAHPRGRHKARVFESRLGLTKNDVEFLVSALKDAVHSDARLVSQDRFGSHYSIDSEIIGPLNTGTVRSIWIVRTGEDFPRLVTCYPMR